MTLTLSVACGAQDGGSNHFKPHFSGQAPGEAQAIFRKFQGSVIAVDPKAMTLSIKLAEGKRVFKVTAKTKVSVGDKPALLKDLSLGKAVEVVLKTVHGQADETVSVKLITTPATRSTPGR